MDLDSWVSDLSYSRMIIIDLEFSLSYIEVWVYN